MRTYLLVVLIGLLFFLGARVYSWWRGSSDPGVATGKPDPAIAFWGPWTVALLLWAFGATAYAVDKDWLRENAHLPSAFIMFGFICIAVIAVAVDKWRGDNKRSPQDERSAGLALTYAGIAASMVVGLLVVEVLQKWVFTEQFRDHQTFILEAVEITAVAVFWVVQTFDRWNDGAPTPEPVAAAPV